MTERNIHPLALVEEGARIGAHVVIEPYAVIKKGVVIEDHVTIKSFAYIDGNTTIGEGTVIYPSACIGTKTQDRKFKGETTYVRIGKGCEIREFVTINSSCQENSVVEVGDHCLIMAYCHIAHNCRVGNHVIMSNNATLAGHVTVEDHAIIGGHTPIHQFVNIGCHSMVGGLSRVTHDILPYSIGGDIPYRFGGINVIGLQRHQIALKTRQELTKAFKILYRSNLQLKDALIQLETELEPIAEVQHLIAFCRATKRGLMSCHSNSPKEEPSSVSV